jgi:hypothetical protein
MNRVLLPLGNRSAEAITTLLNEEGRYAEEALRRRWDEDQHGQTQYLIDREMFVPSISVIWPDDQDPEGWREPMLLVGEVAFGQGQRPIDVEGGDMGRYCHARPAIGPAVGLAGFVSFEGTQGHVTEVAEALESDGLDVYGPDHGIDSVFPLYSASGGLSGRFICYLVVPREKLVFETAEVESEP